MPSAVQEQSFRLAASELGMASAGWLFVGETAAESANDAAASASIGELRDRMGRAWPVLDTLCAGWLAGQRSPGVSVASLLPHLAGAERIVLVGYEALWLDALLAALPGEVRVGLVLMGDPLADWERVLANHGGRIEALSLEDFQSWAGPRSVLLTLVYGATGRHLFVLPAFLRTTGADVRLQFRALLGWHILDVPMELYPRWLVAAEADAVTELVDA